MLCYCSNKLSLGSHVHIYNDGRYVCHAQNVHYFIAFSWKLQILTHWALCITLRTCGSVFRCRQYQIGRSSETHNILNSLFTKMNTLVGAYKLPLSRQVINCVTRLQYLCSRGIVRYTNDYNM